MNTERYSRQSFLGEDAQDRIGDAVVGIVGLGGGGSYIAQQLAHVGFQRYVLYDPDAMEDGNLNREIGAVEADVPAARPKLEIAERLIRGLQPKAEISGYRSHWQDEPLPLRRCDLIFGCVDGAAERRDLEATARRYLSCTSTSGSTCIRRKASTQSWRGRLHSRCPAISACSAWEW